MDAPHGFWPQSLPPAIQRETRLPVTMRNIQRHPSSTTEERRTMGVAMEPKQTSWISPYDARDVAREVQSPAGPPRCRKAKAARGTAGRSVSGGETEREEESAGYERCVNMSPKTPDPEFRTRAFAVLGRTQESTPSEGLSRTSVCGSIGTVRRPIPYSPPPEACTPENHAFVRVHRGQAHPAW